jgi:hypothetical protein
MFTYTLNSDVMSQESGNRSGRGKHGSRAGRMKSGDRYSKETSSKATAR